MEKRLIMIDECGDEVIAETYTIGNDLDKDYLTVWENMKIAQAEDRWPEARGFYFENPAIFNVFLDGYEPITAINYCPCCEHYYNDEDFDFENGMCLECAEES